MSLTERQLALEATVAFRLQLYERAVTLLTQLDQLLGGTNPAVAHNLAVAKCFVPMTEEEDQETQYRQIWQRLIDRASVPGAAHPLVAAHNRAIAYEYLGDRRRGLSEFVCESHPLPIPLMLLKADMALREGNIELAGTLEQQARKIMGLDFLQDKASASALIEDRITKMPVYEQIVFLWKVHVQVALERGQVHITNKLINSELAQSALFLCVEDKETEPDFILSLFAQASNEPVELDILSPALYSTKDASNDAWLIGRVNLVCSFFALEKYHLGQLILEQMKQVIGNKTIKDILFSNKTIHAGKSSICMISINDLFDDSGGIWVLFPGITASIFGICW
jgi:hypothetical protein